MKTVLTFVGWQEIHLRAFGEAVGKAPGRGLALLNGPDGSTISFKTAAQRFPAGFDISAHVCMIVSPSRGLGWLAEVEMRNVGTGYEWTGDASRAWLFDADRQYNVKLANEMAKRAESIAGPDAHAMIVSISEAVEITKANGVRGLEVGSFFAGETVIE